MKTKLLFFILYSLFFIPAFASAAVSVFLDPENISAGSRDTFMATVRIETDGECVNAIEGRIKFDPSVLRAVDFSRGQSLISLWVAPTKIDHNAGTISFSGGIPGGYCGRVSGDPGLTNILGKAVFSPVPNTAAPAVTRIDFSPESEVLLGDGFGTPADAKYRGAKVAIENKESAENEWLLEVRADTIAPEFFTILLDREQNAYNGKYFIAWNTTDKQSGIDHYEVLETNPWKFGFLQNLFGDEKRAYWTRAESPYVLEDQNLRSKIYVKAADKIGNERIAEFNPDTSLLRRVEVDRMWLLVTGILSILVFAITARRMRRESAKKIVL